jgi:hypothetical protein
MTDRGDNNAALSVHEIGEIVGSKLPVGSQEAACCHSRARTPVRLSLVTNFRTYDDLSQPQASG